MSSPINVINVVLQRYGDGVAAISAGNAGEQEKSAGDAAVHRLVATSAGSMRPESLQVLRHQEKAAGGAGWPQHDSSSRSHVSQCFLELRFSPDLGHVTFPIVIIA